MSAFEVVLTVILAVAVVVQAIILFGIYGAIRRMSTYLDGMLGDYLKHVAAISAKVDEAIALVKDTAEGFKPIRDKLVDTTEIIHGRVTEIDKFLAESADLARLQILRVQESIQAGIEKAEQTLDLLHKSLIAPINEINAISRGVRVAMDLLLRRRRNPGSAQDEEMFI
jgi:phage-related minor tail protein